ncbi:alpha-1,4 glucan phosphorylase [Cnuibacter physcomitrellae]|uniref:glycogen phosphorylase n=1 Tax=Cnuibacter physcomitrellae TaxID=1619308 RepID=A0A1X9LP02_9MICO|nr:alpha-glucan family phosphorylase [Cnuibacter physcomitrellae]ARJ04859.1 glycogen phosphorylase [Cnuibacter physcomitrellae]MCS5499067.1 alpha-glucan family phosphorylase [Cnuibacter physcomitrellae]GGI41714.1 alpha-1,4 glucan phosphorylase [Cnuibacter physcomitrellae]
MRAIRRFTVRSVLPESLSALGELAVNLRWAWHEPTRQIFAHISPDVWTATEGDPVAVLGAAGTERLEGLAADPGFVAWANSLRDDLHAYLGGGRWYQQLEGPKPASIGYFSPEFGIAAALPQYSGGLGILAGDHLKAASDLGVPIIGVGLFYRSGYFNQAISREGWQLESYPILDPDGLPLSVLRQADGSPAQIVLALPDDRALYARIWQAQVGRVKLLLLDTDIPDNDDDLRSVTDRLYGGGGEHRLLQEMLLGIGGVRALNILAELTDTEPPEVFHTNEGHAGFQGLERISDLIGNGLTFDEALQVVRAGTVFTTHTPVPAGIDRFDRSLVERYFSTDMLPGLEVDRVLALGAEDYEGGSPDVFNMAVMGLRLAQRANGVSVLHGDVSRGMFNGLWPGFDKAEVPITSVTNGVHAPTWVDPALQELARERLGTQDTTAADWMSPAVGDGELWAVRGRMRRQLVLDARRRVTEAWRAQNPASIPPAWFNGLLDPDVLTIGFARRVPTYKRLTLMLHDPARLKAILLNPERPIQLVVAGKSHPADDEGKRLIQKLVQFASDPEVRHRIVFLPNYDIGMAQTLYPGTDVWLNNPLRPLEACGTSGMKAALNGGLNLSILDGWWNEYYDGDNGWAIPTADGAPDAEERDRLESEALYDLLEHQVAPRFYDRDADGIPANWMASIRHTLATLSPELSAERMVRQYVERLYAPATVAEEQMTSDDYEHARELSAWKERIRAGWPGVAVVHVESGGLDETPQVGEELHVRAQVQLGELSPDDVSVEVVYGHATSADELTETSTVALTPAGESAEGAARVYTGTVPLASSGTFGYTVRIVPRHAYLASEAELGLIAVAH